MDRSRTRPKILIVDDDPVVLRVLERILSELDCAIETAHSGTAALACVLRQEYAVITLDVSMPGMSGLEAARLMREHSNACLTPIIFLTGNAEDEHLVRWGYEVGAVDYLIKPINRLVLATKVRLFLELYEARKSMERMLSRSAAAVDGDPEDAEMRRAATEYRLLLEQSRNIVLRLDDDGCIRWASPGVASALGREPGALVGTAFLELVPEAERPPVHTAIELARSGSESESVEHRVLKASGGTRWYASSLSSLGGAGTVDGALHVWMHDINDRQEALEALRRSALFDSLTSLPNLTLFRDLITERLARTPSEGVTLIMLQLDGLQIVNTSFGRDAADVVLMSAVSRLRDLVRPPAILARIGNQRFAALLTDPPDELAAMREAETIRKALSAPIQHGEMSVVLSHCIGIAVAAEDSRDADDLMQHAEAALARARSIGKNRTELFAREMHLEIRRRLEVEADLRGALERREFRLYYQPLVSLASGEVVGFEALVRWQHPARGLIAPGEFISVAEESELIVPLGRWVLNEGLRQLSCWSAEHDAFAGMRLSVNVSPVQFAGDDFLEVVDAALAQTGIEPRRLVLELTESVLMRDAERTHELFTKLRGRGVRLAMDDFGTGYSSLSYMQRFTMDSLKIDRAFIDGLEGDRQKLAIVKTILSLSDNFEMTTTAEGIETRDQLEIVVDLGCQFGQGYFLARPTPASEIPTLIQRWHPEKGRTTTGTQR